MHSLTRATAELIATAFGAGRFPVAPATFGSAVALAAYWLLSLAGLEGDSPAFFALIAAGSAVGVWATGAILSPTEHDPSRAVWDEVVGMWITMAFLPVTWPWLLAAFFAFRALDIAKTWPMSALERLPRGWGIMADDIAAGVIGAVVLNAVRLLLFN